MLCGAVCLIAPVRSTILHTILVTVVAPILITEKVYSVRVLPYRKNDKISGAAR